MRKKLAIFFIYFLVQAGLAQEACVLTADTMTLPGEQQLKGRSAQVTLKSGGSVQIFIADNDRLLLRFVITENFYFNKVDMLEIKSGTKSYYAKNTKQFKLSKSQGRYTTEIFRNYVVTLKDHGITGLVFNGTETDFSRQDVTLVKQLAQCVHSEIAAKR